MLFVRFAGNEKGVAFQTEQALKLLKNAEIVMDDADLWKKIAADASIARTRIREAPSGTAKVLMERIKRQLDPEEYFSRGLTRIEDGLETMKHIKSQDRSAAYLGVGVCQRVACRRA